METMASSRNWSGPGHMPVMLSASRAWVHAIIVAILAVAIVGFLGWRLDYTRAANVAEKPWRIAGFGPADYADAEKQIAGQLELARERVRLAPRQWLPQEGLARAYMAKAALSPTYDELASAARALEKSNSLAPERSGPLLTSAVFAMRTHQLDAVASLYSEARLSAVSPGSEIAAEWAAITGDVAYYRGNVREASRRFANSEKIGGQGAADYRLAVLAKSKGDYSGAIRIFKQINQTQVNSTPFETANLALRIGGIELARGNFAQSNAWFERADEQFPGFWLTEAHLAQGRALDGDLAGAISDMTAIAEKSASAEVMDALAVWLRADGQAQESRMWAARAAAIWQVRLQQLPAAALGHALEHELVFGEPQRALELARQNVRARPYGDSYLLLASALISNGQITEALSNIDRAENTGWRSASLFALRSQALELNGKHGSAKIAREDAVALNPHIFSPITQLVWFSHG